MRELYASDGIFMIPVFAVRITVEFCESSSISKDIEFTLKSHKLSSGDLNVFLERTLIPLIDFFPNASSYFLKFDDWILLTEIENV